LETGVGAHSIALAVTECIVIVQQQQQQQQQDVD